MMDSVRLFLRNFIKYFLYIAVFAQIVTGTVYLVCNFTEYIVYPETEEMVHVARGLLFDEYTGILYPLFIRLCLGIQELTGIGYYLVAHLVQFLLSAGTVLYLVKSFYKGKKAWIAMAYILSFPMYMQTVFMVSPFAFKAAFSVVILGAMFRIWREKKRVVSWCILFGAYVLEAFNVTDDLYMWMLPIFIFVVAYIIKNRQQEKIWKKLCLILIAGLLFAGCIGVMNRVVEPGGRGRMQRTIESVLFQRSLWPELRQKYGFLPMDIRCYIDPEDAIASNAYSEKFVYVIGPRVDREAGFERANELYMESFKNQLSYNKRALFGAVWKDFTGYLLTPYGTVKYLLSQEGSCFSSLYGAMNASNPKFVYFYLCIGFVSLFVTSFSALLRMIKEQWFVKKALVRRMLALGSVLVYQALWYSIANVQGVDYRYVLLNIALFSIFALSGTVPENEQTKEEKKKDKHKVFFQDKKKRHCIGLFCVAAAVIFVGILLLTKDYRKDNLLAGEQIVCLGDSIWGLVTDETGIASLVENMTGATVVNYAIPGTTATDTKDTGKGEAISEVSLMQLIKKLEEGDIRGVLNEEVFEQAEYLVIAYGLNDYFHGLPVVPDNEEDISSYEGALDYAVSYFKERYPALQIVLIGQTYCQFYSYGIVEDDSDTKDFGGGVGYDYVKAVERVAKKHNVMFINQYDKLPMNEWNGKQYLEDATHLNQKGRIEYAKVVSEYIMDDYKERNAK